MGFPANVWINKVNSECSYQPELRTYRSVIDSREDMEFSDYSTSEDGWFYVYDAFNDGDLSGPEDKAYIGAHKRYNNSYDSYKVEGVIKDVKGDKAFEQEYQHGKLRAIKSHIRKILLPGRNGIEDANISLDERGDMMGFRDPTLDIDDVSYPEGMQMLRDAAGISHLLDESAKLFGVYDRLGFDVGISFCRGYSRSCPSIAENVNFRSWLKKEDYLNYLTHPCPNNETEQRQLLQSKMERLTSVVEKLAPR